MFLTDTAEAYFIAEAGVNHNGQLDRAERLVEVAANAGADAVKFQTFSADRLTTEDAPKAEYQQETTGESSQFEMLERYELDRAAHERLQRHCREHDITFLSTPFDPESADLLADLDVPAIKLGSGELDNLPLLEHIAEIGRPMIVSTGMGTMDEVHRARDAIRSVDPDVELAFLHCTSEYPADLADANLAAMERMRRELPEPVGYSDHTTNVETPAFAVAAGASIVEKHFTMDKTLPGPDHRFALEPDELREAVALVRDATTARGRPEKHPTDGELEMKQVIRKSVHATSEIAEGERITPDDVAIIRPADGIPPSRMSAVVGATATDDLSPGDPVTADVLTDVEESNR